MTQYGLPGIRENDGSRKKVDHTFEWDGQEVTIRLIPPTISQHEEYEELGEEATAGQLASILDRHLVKPDVGDDPTARELFCYLEGIIDYGVGGGGELGDEVRDELEARQATGAEGN